MINKIKVKVDNYYNEKPAFFYTYENCPISETLRNNIIWEKHLHNIFEEYITPDSIVIEGGCHIGSHTIKLGMLAKHVFAFEPMPSSYDILKTNIDINNLQNITIIRKGLSNVCDTSYFEWMPNNNLSGSGLAKNPMGKPVWIQEEQNKILVDLTTIDLLNLDRLDFIKLDIEGYETLAILGGLKTIEKFKPIITLEVWSNHDGGIDMNYTKEIFKNLIEIGYNVVNIGGPDFVFFPK